MVSAIEHYSYCPRQCALIHLECVFEENVYTIRGSLAHSRVDEPNESLEQGVVIERALPIWSDRFGLAGRADVVEIHSDGEIVPVEHKITPSNRIRHAKLQLCGQSICLEEMFGKRVRRGAVYSSHSRQRVYVDFTEETRRHTLQIVEDIRKMLLKSELPPPVNDARCTNCSLVQVCLPSEIESSNLGNCRKWLFLPLDAEVAE